MSRPGSIERYLARYAMLERLPEPGKRYRFVLTIPAFDEHPDFLEQTLVHNREADVLTIVTVNTPDQVSAPQQARTRDLLAAIRATPHTFAIDRVTVPVPHRQGVGLARKLAADLACALIERGDIACPIIFMTDADVTLPQEYFQAAVDLERGTALYPFRHESTRHESIRHESAHHPGDGPSLQSRADLYELHLRHYVAGLSNARSPYDYQTLGSTIAMHADTYARVRGMPRRNAGEDFYLLNKAAKVDPITSLATPRLSIEARPSPRVPFGTGPALASMPTNVEEFVSYSPEVFRMLATVLQSMKSLGSGHEPIELPPQAEAALTDLGWQPSHFRERHDAGPKRLRAIMEWFDGFRTMRFIRMVQTSLVEHPLLDTLRTELDAPGASPSELLAIFRTDEVNRTSGIDAHTVG